MLDAGPLQLDESLQHWVNDALMVIFFFVVGLEIKYELVNGDLRDPKTAALPIVAAIGGMVVPAALYVAFNPPGSDGADGWGIPMATDIAFAVGVLGVLGRRIPSAARLFLLTLAIVDDIGAILVIAVFYTDDLSLGWLAIAIALLACDGRGSDAAYLDPGRSTPSSASGSGSRCWSRACTRRWPVWPSACWPRPTPLLNEEVARGYAARGAARQRRSTPTSWPACASCSRSRCPSSSGCRPRCTRVSAYLVLPIFALANAGVELGAIGDVFTAPVGLGIIVGLVIGKPIGILAASWIAVRLGLGRLPDRTTWPMVLGLGAVGGIGFTVSIFIAGLSFPDAERADRRGEDRHPARLGARRGRGRRAAAAQHAPAGTRSEAHRCG